MPASVKYLPGHERRALTVATVVALAGEQNPSAITTAAIAQRMGLTQGALFRHFPSKDAILEAVMHWVAGQLMARTETAIQGEVSPLAALERLFLAHVDFVVAHPGIPRLLFGELQHPEETAPKRLVQELVSRYGARLQKVIEAGLAAGELDPRLDARAAATLFIGTIQGLVMQSLLAGEVRRMRREAPGVFAIYRRGIVRVP